MSSNYEIRLSEPDEENKLLKLLNEAFKGWPHFDLQCEPVEHWRWKHRDNPFGESKVIVADDGGELVGCMHLDLNKLKVGSKSYLCTQGVDGAVLASHREFGVFTKMRSISETLYPKGEIGLHYNVSSNPYVAKTFQKVDPDRYPVPLSFMIRIEDMRAYTKPLTTTKKVLITSGYHGARILSKLKNPLMKERPKSSHELTISELMEFDNRIDDFWNEIKESSSLIQTLSREYLNWRFCDPRGGAYVIRQAEEDGKIVGFTVLRISSYGANQPSGFIVALYGLPGKLDYAKAMLDDALGYFREQGINTVRYCINKGHPYEGMFGGSGFVVAPGEVLFTTVARSIGGDYEEYKNSPPEKVLFQYGSSDWI